MYVPASRQVQALTIPRTAPEKQPPDCFTDTDASIGPVPSGLSSDGSTDPGQQGNSHLPKTGPTFPSPFF